MQVAGEYLNQLVASWPLYRLLYTKAMDVLPPPELAAGTCRERIACGLTLSILAKALGMSPSTVRHDLRRLLGYRWVQDKMVQRLGSRAEGVVHLLADVAAEEATGEVCLVSRRILRVDRNLSRAAPKATRPVGRGLARRWEP